MLIIELRFCEGWSDSDYAFFFVFTLYGVEAEAYVAVGGDFGICRISWEITVLSDIKSLSNIEKALSEISVITAC